MLLFYPFQKIFLKINSWQNKMDQIDRLMNLYDEF